jgi:putative dehydrogenase
LDKNAQDFRRPLPAGEIAAIPIVGRLHHQYVRREVKSMLSARRAGTIAVIGAGEMGAAVAHQMLSKGARVLTTLRGRSAASAERVRLAGIEVVDDDDAIALEAGFLLSIVPPGQAIAVARRFHGPLARAAKKPVFVECNAISPDTMRRIADALESSGCKLVDAGIIGGPPRTDRRYEGPRFYASGQDAHLVSDLGKFGLDVQIVDGPSEPRRH